MSDLSSVPLSRPASGPVGAAGFAGLLVDAGLTNRRDLARAEQHAAREGLDLAAAIVALGGAEETAVYQLLAQAAGAPFIVLNGAPVSELAVRLVTERLARKHLVLPLTVDNRTISYASCCPFAPEAESDIAFASGRRAAVKVATRSAILEALDLAYPKARRLDVLAERLTHERVALGDDAVDLDSPTESTVIDLCNQIIARAVDVGASDVHFECGRESTTIRYRICGVLEPVLTLPGSASPLIRNRLKVMARADIAIQNRPQDGAFRLDVHGRPVDIRLSALPTVGGEKIVLRVIDSQSPLCDLDSLGYDEATLVRLKKALARPDGLVMVTGPTGSGKTTALYGALGHLQTGRTNIVSVEDPVERTLPGLTQIPVNAKAGNSFASVLRALMRQDPNVIMVGEVRDPEVAQIVGQAAYTGHMVLTSLHTADAASAVTRLTNLGLEPFKVAESLTAVLAQRLLRTLCPACRRVHNELEARRLGTLHGLASIPASAGAGCDRCRQTGFDGRAPVAELLTPSEALRSTIARGATSHEIRAAMRADGAPTMRDQALELVRAGITSIEEVNRVLADDELSAPAVRSRAGHRVLVIDDEPITRMLVKLLLEKDGYDVLEAADGATGVQVAQREVPDLILTDLHMPTMDGYQAIEKLRTDPRLATVPILVLTAEEGPGVEQRVLDMGADDYMLKPFEPDVLLSRVKAVFRRLKLAVA